MLPCVNGFKIPFTLRKSVRAHSIHVGEYPWKLVVWDTYRVHLLTKVDVTTMPRRNKKMSADRFRHKSLRERGVLEHELQSAYGLKWLLPLVYTRYFNVPWLSELAILVL
jgi:hypothetical protein